MTPRTLLLCAVFALVAFATGVFVGRGPSGRVAVDFRHSADRNGTRVATFADDAITAEELEQRFAQMAPSARARYQTLEQKREYLEGLLRHELLAREAQDRGLAQDPEVRETAKKVMVQRLLAQLDEQTRPPTEAELNEYFELHRSDYVRPEMLRLSHVFLAAPRDNSPLTEATRKRAEAILAEAAQAAPQDFRTFGQLAVKNSEEPRTRTLEGDLRYLSREELATQYGPEVAAAADALKEPGQLAPLVQTERGFHVLKLRSREPAVTQDAQSVKAQLVTRITHERRNQRYESFLESLRTKWKVKVDDARLAKVPVDPSAAARPMQGPPPGFVPAPPRSGGAMRPSQNVAPEAPHPVPSATRP